MNSEIFFIKIKEEKLENYLPIIRDKLNKIQELFNFNKNEIIPVKITIGDSSCIYNIKPELIKIIIELLKNKGAKPFLFDTSVIYKGRRQNAIDHYILAQNKGYSISKIGVPYIIADGLLGLDGREYEINSKYLNKIKIPSFIGILDNLVVLTHVTGHILTMYAGAIKNVAMGMSCKPTKQIIHSSEKQSIIPEKCTYCGSCLEVCPTNAIVINETEEKAKIDKELCIGCAECLCVCNYGAIKPIWKENHLIFVKRIVEITNFILSKFRNKIFVNVLLDITKNCDCVSDYKEKRICHNIGILISKDILSIEKASIDLISKEGYNFYEASYNAEIEMLLSYAKEKELGKLDYELIEI